MDKKQIEQTLQLVKKNSPKRNFKQSVDLIINLKDINLKNPDEQVNMFVTLHNELGKEVSICALVGPELEAKAKAACNEVILAEDLSKFKDKKAIKQLADKHDFFIAQANLMAKVATAFGRVFGPRGKMPNPKVGAVVPPNANLDQLTDKLRKTIQLQTKTDATVRCMVGKEDASDEQLMDNIMTAFTAVLQKLPNERNNIKSIMLKLSMGPSFTVGGKEEAEEKQAAKEDKKEAAKEQSQSEEKSPAEESADPKEEPAKEEKAEAQE